MHALRREISEKIKAQEKRINTFILLGEIRNNRMFKFPL